MKKLFGFVVFFLLTLSTAMAQMTVTGTLLESDGKPMPKANVSLTTMMRDTILKIVEVDKNGKYSITIDSAGIWNCGAQVSITAVI